MSNSLHKKKPLLKQNNNRLSNSKIISVYSGGNLSRINCNELGNHLHNCDDKPHNSSKRTNRNKTNRKNQMSVEHILQSKHKQPYSVRSFQIQKEKTKPKKKKKQKGSHQNSKFILPLADFSSRSNSLIVFSEKDSTINGNLFNKSKDIYFAKELTANQAAIIIQKTWRGYLTRKLLQQYINDEQYKLTTAINRLKQKEDSFFVELKVEQANQHNFSMFSSINQDTLNKLGKNQIDQQEDYQTNVKNCVSITQLQSNNAGPIKDSPCVYKSFFKNNKTEADILSTHKSTEDPVIENSNKGHQRNNLAIQSTVFTYNLCNKFSDEAILRILQEEPLAQKIDRIKSYIELELKQMKKDLKQKLTLNQIDLEEMLKRNNKIKQIYQGSNTFLYDVMTEIKAMVEDMNDIVQNGVSCQQPHEKSHYRAQPKSQLFTIELADNEPEIAEIKQSFSEGQIKLQTYINQLIEQYECNYPQLSQLEYLCEILKRNSQRGVSNIFERCLVQFTIQIITENYALHDLCRLINQKTFGNTKEEEFLSRWVKELNKWQMGPIQQVTQAMQSSSFLISEASKPGVFETK